MPSADSESTPAPSPESRPSSLPCVARVKRDLSRTGPAPKHLRILHVVKVPPSNSGVAHCGLAMSASLRHLGDVEVIGVNGDAQEAQRPTVIWNLLKRVRKSHRRAQPDLAVVELSGRGIAEFAAALWLTGRKSIQTWLVVHDTPALVGPSLLISPLDRRGGRRFGIFLSNTIGAKLENSLVSRADRVLALSELGAKMFAAQHGGVRVDPIPHPVLPRDPVSKNLAIYFPATADVDVIEQVMIHLRGSDEQVTVRIGNVSCEHETRLRRFVADAELACKLEFTGRLDDERLDACYDDVLVTVRARTSRGDQSNSAAASGPIVSAMAAGSAVLAVDPRGSGACLHSALGLPVLHDVVELGTTLMPGIEVGERAMVGAMSLVTRDVEPCTVVIGVPAKPVGPVTDVRCKHRVIERAYPWPDHLRRGYPDGALPEPGSL